MTTLKELADSIAPFDEFASHGPKLRVALNNFTRGMEQRGANLAGMHHRLASWLHALPASLSPFHVDHLFDQLHDVLEHHIGDIHFLSTDRPVQNSKDFHALSVATQAAITPWLGAKPDEYTSDPEAVRDFCADLNARAYKAGASAGKPDDAVWLTPLIPDAAKVIESAEYLQAANTPANDPRYADLANRVRDVMGLSQYDVGTCLIALVSTGTIADLIAEDEAAKSHSFYIMGPSILEGRCHSRWRHWPEDYGRTYHLNSGADVDGVAEAVRHPLPLQKFAKFVYLGPITEEYSEPDSDFSTVIGASSPIDQLLLRLHALTGL